MSFFSNHSHSQSYTATATNDSSAITTPSYAASASVPRQRTTPSNTNANTQPHLRSSSSKLSLSISSPPEIRDRTLTSSSTTPATSTVGTVPQNNHNGASANGGLYSSATPTVAVTSGVLTKGGPTPLRNTWVFWFRQQPKALGNKAAVNYEEGIKKVAAFSSVESFWSLQTHLHTPSSLAPTTDYLLFHSGVRRPVWEDPLNQYGGKWIIRLRKGIADRLWEDLVLAVIGDQFDSEDGISGVVLSVRSAEDILSVWNRDDKDAEAKGRIRDMIRRALGLPKETIMEYKSNNDSMNDKSSFRTTSTSTLATLGSLGLQGGQNLPSTPG
ncbi:hypothetical protein FRB95_005109 [Tulasnella sp. JGI-2019a]|nr:hypothetical protein FRB95_005109 [Tulasnella sp. JGI-2019a]